MSRDSRISMPRRGAPNPPPAPNAPPAPLIITNPHLLDEDIPPPHPDEQYAPLGTDASYRKQRIIDLALQDPCLAESCLARMRVYEPVPNQPPNRRAQDIRYTRRLELAPLDWYEFYSNLRVESWVYMWVHAFDEGPTRGGQLGIKAEYQYHIPGPYKIRSREWDDDPQFSREAVRRFKVPTHGPGRQVKAAFVDFIWLPPANDRAGVNPIVMMEVRFRKRENEKTRKRDNEDDVLILHSRFCLTQTWTPAPSPQLQLFELTWTEMQHFFPNNAIPLDTPDTDLN